MPTLYDTEGMQLTINPTCEQKLKPSIQTGYTMYCKQSELDITVQANSYNNSFPPSLFIRPWYDTCT